MRRIHSIITSLVIACIRLYQLCISPLFPNSCRYYPSCSVYTKGAFKKHGLFTGFWLAVKRILRCNVLFPGGYDPIP